MSVTFTVTLSRTTANRPNDELVKTHVNELIEYALTGTYKNWEASKSPAKLTQDSNGNWVYSRQVRFSQAKGARKALVSKQWDSICTRLILCGQRTKYGKHPWMVSGSGAEERYKELADADKVPDMASRVDAEESADQPEDKNKKKPTISIKSFGEINTEPGNHFDHIFDREHQRRIILSAIIAAKESNFVNRFNCVLYGEPGCGKSDLLISTGKMLGKENEAWMKLDATSTTEAGAQRILLESAWIPPVLIVEEIEKTDEKSLRWLLGILDQRAEIRKTNFNIGHRARNVKMLCLATVNDLPLFKKVMSGALASRFPNEIHCPRPTRAVMERILLREVNKVNGKQEWIEPALKFCMDEMKWNDPRKIVPICLCGRDDLLTGSYQESVLATMPPPKDEAQKGVA